MREWFASFKIYRWWARGIWVKWHGRWLRAERTGAITYVDEHGIRHHGHTSSSEIEARESYRISYE